ncbi:MAG: tyrosine-type recombinase/integrase, partial [Candidatus Bathyarchaeota archaeon]|nr:tyrosine-type recombinase/integrase [Candidatus Bathyarchaeota archaeon]
VEDASRLVNSILDSRDKCILVLLFKTGMRLGELTSLDVGDVDLDKGEVTLKLKKKRSNRVLFLDDEAIAVLQKWLAARKNRMGAEDKALFLSKIGTRITKRSIEEVIEKHAERLGMHNHGARLEERFTPHCCRHWFVTHLLRAGMSRDFVKELRGDTRGEAIDIYNHIDRKDLRESYLAHIFILPIDSILFNLCTNLRICHRLIRKKRQVSTYFISISKFTFRLKNEAPKIVLAGLKSKGALLFFIPFRIFLAWNLEGLSIANDSRYFQPSLLPAGTQSVSPRLRPPRNRLDLFEAL